MSTDGAPELRRNSVSDKCCSLFPRYRLYCACIWKIHLLTEHSSLAESNNFYFAVLGLFNF